MSDSTKYQQVVLKELADIHAQLTMLTDFVISTQSQGTATPERKKQLAARIAQLRDQKFALLCSQAGVVPPPESPRS